jgi:hypothetical protein
MLYPLENLFNPCHFSLISSLQKLFVAIIISYNMKIIVSSFSIVVCLAIAYYMPAPLVDAQGPPWMQQTMEALTETQETLLVEQQEMQETLTLIEPTLPLTMTESLQSIEQVSYASLLTTIFFGLLFLGIAPLFFIVVARRNA